MNRLLILCFCAFLLPKISFSQSTGLCMQVLASSGGNGQQGNFQVSWTVGEPVINTISNANRKLTQGFHQHDVCLPVSTWNLDVQALGIELFPNPTVDFLTIRHQAGAETNLFVSAYGVMGEQMLAPRALDVPDGTVLELFNWPPGLYFIKIEDAATEASATFRVVHL